jgi:hypothetical protein
MSVTTRLHELFPASRADAGGTMYLKTREGIVEGRIVHADDNGFVVDTGRGTVMVLKRAVIAISDREEALVGWRKPREPPHDGSARPAEATAGLAALSPCAAP